MSLLALPAIPALAQDKPARRARDGRRRDGRHDEGDGPGEPQQKLLASGGDWTYTSKMWMAPGQPPMESSGTMHGEMILGGRYLEMTLQGKMMGMPFEGRATEGYDNVAKQYVGSWVDNFGTGISSTGTCDDGVKVHLPATSGTPSAGRRPRPAR